MLRQALRPLREKQSRPHRSFLQSRQTRQPNQNIMEARKFVAADDVYKMVDVRIRMTLRGGTAEAVEEIVRARREIWGGRSGRKFPTLLQNIF